MMNATNIMNGMFGKIDAGLCRMSIDGDIAIKVGPNEYKSYDVKSGRLTNCSNFVFDIGEEWFFVIPTNKVSVGDIILVAGEPRCVTKVDKDEITTLNYKTSVKETIIPEHYMFMGNTYYYGKIVSLMGDVHGKGKNRIFKYMMMSEMFKNNSSGNGMMGNIAQMMPMMMFMNKDFGSVFTDMFNFDEEDDTVEEDV